MSSNAFSYLDDLYEPGAEVPPGIPTVEEKPQPGTEEQQKDDFDELGEYLAKQHEEEKIFKSNQYGTGFDPELSEGNGTYEPQSLNARHREIIRLYALGYKQVNIAGILGITPVTVGYVVNSPLGQSFLMEIDQARTGSVKDVQERLQEMSPFAAEIFADVMSNSKSESRRLEAAEKVLKMTGHNGENKNIHLHTHLTREEIEEIKHQAKGGPETVEEATLIEAGTSKTEESDGED